MLTAFLKGLNAQIHKQMSTDKFFRCEITLRDVYCTVSFNTERSDYGFILCKVHTEAELLGGGQLYRGTCTLKKLQALFPYPIDIISYRGIGYRLEEQIYN